VSAGRAGGTSTLSIRNDRQAVAIHGGCCTNPGRGRWIVSNGGFRNRPPHPSREPPPSRGRHTPPLWRPSPRSRSSFSETALCDSVPGRRRPPLRNENLDSGTRSPPQGVALPAEGADSASTRDRRGTVVRHFPTPSRRFTGQCLWRLEPPPRSSENLAAAGLTPARLGAVEPVGQCGAGACGTVDCCHERESQTRNWEAPTGGS
jgi:hypothetical protein